jgi:Fe2+ transport system protein FeoA
MTGDNQRHMKTLAEAPLRKKARIVAVNIQGVERERLQNHGFIEHNEVVPVRNTPSAGARVYRVMNTLVALRAESAECILVEVEEQEGDRGKINN